MNDEIIEIKDPTPILEDKKCKFIALAIQLFLSYFIYVATAIGWYIYDYFIAFFVLILSFVIMGIVRSKLRNISIPLKQIEYQYSDEEISRFYTSKEICY